MVETAGLEYVEILNYEISADSMELIKKEISSNVNSSLSKFNNFSVTRTSSSDDIYAQVIGDADSLLSIAQRDYVREILSLMENETDIDKFLVRLSVIEQNVNETLIPDEQPVILTVASVARYSQVYWNENQEKWISEFGGENSDGKLEINWKLVGGFDAAAAVGSGGAVAIASLGGPVGWGFAISVVAGSTTIVSGAAIWAT